MLRCIMIDVLRKLPGIIINLEHVGLNFTILYRLQELKPEVIEWNDELTSYSIMIPHSKVGLAIG